MAKRPKKVRWDPLVEQALKEVGKGNRPAPAVGIALVNQKLALAKHTSTGVSWYLTREGQRLLDAMEQTADGQNSIP